MDKYVLFINNDGAAPKAKAIIEKSITSALITDMKKNRFSKHFLSVEAKDENEAIKKFNEHNKGYLNSLGEYSGSYAFGAFIVCVMAIVYWLL